LRRNLAEEVAEVRVGRPVGGILLRERRGRARPAGSGLSSRSRYAASTVCPYKAAKLTVRSLRKATLRACRVSWSPLTR
jgi:hypothetical protein